MLTPNEISILNALVEEETDRTYWEKDSENFEILSQYRRTLSVIMEKLSTMDQGMDIDINDDTSISFAKFSQI